MKAKGSILVISSWILAILVIFALGIGQRASIELKISRYQRDNLKASLLAQAAVKRMIYELQKDNNGYDSLSEAWINNEKAFSKIMTAESSGDFASIEYSEDNEKIFGAVDEERKINLNEVNQRLIEELFNQKGFAVDAVALSQLIQEWISSAEEADESKKFFKNEKLKVKEELIPILEYFYQDKEKAWQVYSKINDSFTVYGGTKVNINTAARDTLLILARALASTEEQRAVVDKLVDDLIKLRDAQLDKAFKDISGITSLADFSPEELSLFDNLGSFLSVKSNYFSIKAKGVSGFASRDIEAIYDRENKRIVYWHQK
jgi:type II secretory pathway component PulK